MQIKMRIGCMIQAPVHSQPVPKRPRFKEEREDERMKAEKKRHCQHMILSKVKAKEKEKKRRKTAPRTDLCHRPTPNSQCRDFLNPPCRSRPRPPRPPASSPGSHSSPSFSLPPTRHSARCLQHSSGPNLALCPHPGMALWGCGIDAWTGQGSMGYTGSRTLEGTTKISIWCAQGRTQRG